MTQLATPRPFARAARLALRLAFVVGLAMGAHYGMGLAISMIETLPPHRQGTAMLGLLTAAIVIFALLVAIPFVPGIEIGVALLALRGPSIAPFVYLACVGGLSLSFMIGARLSLAAIRRLLLDLGLVRMAALAQKLAPLPLPRKLELLRRVMPRRLGLILTRSRYVALAALLNMPGNTLIGGGGGLCLLAGLSGIYAPRAAILTIALAVLPIPLAVWLWGADIAAMLSTH